MLFFRKYTFRDRKKEKQKWEKPVYFVSITMLLYAIISLVFWAPMTLDNPSMEPSIPENGRVVISPAVFGKTIWNNRILPEFSVPRRGDVVLFVPPYYTPDHQFFNLINPLVRFLTFQKLSFSSWHREPWENRHMIKRVIGVPGDRIKIENNQAFIKPPGSDFYLSEFEMSSHRYDIGTEPLPEGWVNNLLLSDTMDERLLGEDEYFVMGDNRSHSSDSRHWGVIGKRHFIGRALWLYWPPRKIGKI